tara:strand:- start:3923 stop:6109 length:2187 start_codon:yes stop_codon:yes gene_type:complete
MKLLLLLLLLLSPFTFIKGQSDTINKNINEVTVLGTRALENFPYTFSELSQKDIEKQDLGKCAPAIFNFTPSIIFHSDAGNDIGYSSLRLRGSDMTRLNLTINGIPINDAESQGVWWVDFPDIISSATSIQIQRGVGTTTYGEGSFGGNINILTKALTKESYLNSKNSFGSFNSFRNTIEFGTGIINKHWTLDGRLSSINSDGYIDKANSDLKSIYIAGGHIGKNSTTKLISFIGQEETYQAWYGVPVNYINIDSLKTYNPYNYENQIDNYTQINNQLHHNVDYKDFNINISLFSTLGDGYYEQFSENQILNDYLMDNIIIGNDTINSSDIITRKWLDNTFSGFTINSKNRIKKTTIMLGLNGSIYEGRHFGEIIWMEFAGNSNIRHLFYDNDAEKNILNGFIKLNYDVNEKFKFLLEINKKNITYKFYGLNSNGIHENQNIELKFMNPKIGFTHKINKNQLSYISLGIANNEPNRNDYINSSPESRPQAEKLFDIEAGYKIKNEKLSISINTYHMNYENQLILTGEINNVGAQTRMNVKNSYRRGLELVLDFKGNYISNNFNATLSQNKIKRYIQFTDNWDNNSQKMTEYNNTNIALSPQTIVSNTFSLHPSANLEVNLESKFVGKQYLDNTSSQDRMLDEYLMNNLGFIYSIKSALFKSIELNLKIYNLFDVNVTPSGWSYSFISNNYDPRQENPYTKENHEGGYDMIGLFPQATRNYTIGLNIKF